MKKTKNPNNERNARIASYLISLGLHLLLLILFALFLTVNSGGDQRGGASLAMASTIDVMLAETSDSVNTVSTTQPTREQTPDDEQTRPTPPVTDEPTPEDVITEAVKPEPPKPHVEQPRDNTPHETSEHAVDTPENTDNMKPTPPKPSNSEAESAEVDSSGSGSNLPRNTDGSGMTDHEGLVPSYGAFTTGSFGGLKNVPECKKDDADNNDLKFVYDIEYGEGTALPTIKFLSSTTQRINTSTIQQTMRILLESFNPDAVQMVPGRTLKGQIVCQCGYEPKCNLKQ